GGVGGGGGLGAGVSARASSQVGTCSTVRSSGSSAGGAVSSFAFCSCCRCAASVARKSSASGPSRMLARRRAIQHLPGELAVHGRCLAARVVLQDRLSLHRSLCIPHSLADLRVEQEI